MQERNVLALLLTLGIGVSWQRTYVLNTKIKYEAHFNLPICHISLHYQVKPQELYRTEA